MALRDLPTELIERILLLSLPSLHFSRYDFAHFEKRNELLLSYSLVSRVWLEVAQAELYRNLWVGDAEMEDRLWQKVGAQNGVKELRATKIWCGRWPTWGEGQVFSAHFVDRVLSYCPNVRTVSLSALGLTSFDFSAFERVQKLHCNHVEFYGTGPSHILPRPPKPLPSLIHLTLDEPFLDGGGFGPWSNLLGVQTLPNLRHLALQSDSEFQDFATDEDSLVDAIASRGDALESLAFLVDPDTNDVFGKRMASLTSLRHLYFCASMDWMPLQDINLSLPPLPPLLKSLRLSLQLACNRPEVWGPMGRAVALALKPLEDIETVTFASASSSSSASARASAEDDHAGRASYEPLRAMMEQKGGRLALFEQEDDIDTQWWRIIT